MAKKKLTYSFVRESELDDKLLPAVKAARALFEAGQADAAVAGLEAAAVAHKGKARAYIAMLDAVDYLARDGQPVMVAAAKPRGKRKAAAGAAPEVPMPTAPEATRPWITAICQRLEAAPPHFYALTMVAYTVLKHLGDKKWAQRLFSQARERLDANGGRECIPEADIEEEDSPYAELAQLALGILNGPNRATDLYARGLSLVDGEDQAQHLLQSMRTFLRDKDRIHDAFGSAIYETPRASTRMLLAEIVAQELRAQDLVRYAYERVAESGAVGGQVELDDFTDAVDSHVTSAKARQAIIDLLPGEDADED